ncbi:MAG: 50S ribosomal protein L35 [Oscillospiraceae bacterium]|nr:50S ribosomal protein L35 [Oscillospiraceae bacterium]
MAGYKLKTNKSARKRFKFSKTGKIKRAAANRSHILTKKTQKRKRHLRKPMYVDKTNAKAISLLIPYKR